MRRTQASTDALCTSKPAQRRKMFSMSDSLILILLREGHRKEKQSALRALAQARRQFGIRRRRPDQTDGRALLAPRLYGLHPAQNALSIVRFEFIFMLCGCREAT